MAQPAQLQSLLTSNFALKELSPWHVAFVEVSDTFWVYPSALCGVPNHRYGQGKGLAEFEALVASSLGMEAGAFFPTGTSANRSAVTAAFELRRSDEEHMLYDTHDRAREAQVNAK